MAEKLFVQVTQDDLKEHPELSVGWYPVHGFITYLKRIFAITVTAGNSEVGLTRGSHQFYDENKRQLTSPEQVLKLLQDQTK